jgi:hypothetical protein
MGKETSSDQQVDGVLICSFFKEHTNLSDKKQLLLFLIIKILML